MLNVVPSLKTIVSIKSNPALPFTICRPGNLSLNIILTSLPSYHHSASFFFLDKTGARGHKISDYFEVSSKTKSLFGCCFLFFLAFIFCFNYGQTFLRCFLTVSVCACVCLRVCVSLREVAVLVPALLGESHQSSALPRNTPSQTPLSRWARLLCNFSSALNTPAIASWRACD